MTDNPLEADVDSTQDIVLKIDVKKKITFASPAVAKLGYEVSDVIGFHIMEMIDEENMYEALCRLTTRRTGERATTNFPVRLKVKKESSMYSDTPFKEFIAEARGLWKEPDNVVQDKGFDKEYLGTMIVARLKE